MTMSKVAPATPTRMAADGDRRQAPSLGSTAQVGDRGDDQHAGEQQPRHALAEAAEQRQAHAVDEPAPTGT